MKLSTLLVITAVVALIFGILFVLVPTTMLSIYGLTQGPAEALVAQYFGTSLIFAGLVAWLMRKVTDASAQRAVVLGFLITDVLGVIISLIGTLSGTMNSVGWTVVIIYLLLAIGFASIQFKKPAAP
jgi:hypothetical protein